MASLASLTIGGSSFSVYVSIVNAAKYLGADPVLAPIWAALTGDEPAQHIVRATRVLDRVGWKGDRTESDQANAWYRTGITGVEDDELPQSIADACCELAGLSASGIDIVNFQSTAPTEKRIKAGSVEVENFKNFDAATYPLPQAAWLLIKDYLEQGGSISAFAGFGTDGCSITKHGYTHNSGF